MDKNCRVNVRAFTISMAVMLVMGLSGIGNMLAAQSTVDITSVKAQYSVESPNYGGTCPTLTAGVQFVPPSSDFSHKSYIEFNLSSIPSGATVQSASLRLVKSGGSGVPFTMRLMRNTSSWVEGTDCGSGGGTLPSFNSTPVTTFSANPADAIGTVYTIDITALVQGWVNGTFPNYGLTLQGPDSAPTFSNMDYYSDDYGTASDRPRLIVDFTPPCTASAASSSPTVCQNTAIPNITHNTTAATGIGTPTGLPTGVTASWASNVITISGTPTAAGTFMYSIPLTGGGCSGVNATGTITLDILSGTVSRSDVTCYAQNDGTITVSAATGGSGSYEYRLNLGSWQPGGSFTGLVAGSYLVQIRDANNPTCVIELGLQDVTQPASLVSNGIVSNVTCSGSTNGSITQTVSGGTSPYSYVWSGGGAVTKDRTGLSAGMYTVTITDNNLCSITRTYNVVQPSAVIITPTVTQPECGIAGSILISISGGTSPYTFNWSDLVGSNDPQNRSNLTGGVYAVTVTDANGCTGTGSYTLTTPNCGPGETVCIAGNSAAVYSVTPDPFVTTYNWTVSNGGIIVSGQGTPEIVVNWTSATPGAGEICVSTENDCGESTQTCKDIVLKLVDATASASPTCSGGSLALTANGGDTYVWSGPLGYSSNLQNPVINNVTTGNSGTYTVTVTDSEGCTASASVLVTVSAGFTVTVDAFDSACGLNIGAIDITITGGLAPFEYLWSNGSMTEDLTDLSGGNYSLTVTDGNDVYGTQ